MKRKIRSLLTLLVILAIALFSYLNQDKPSDYIGESSTTTSDLTIETIDQATDETTVETASDTNVSGTQKIDEETPYYEASDVALFIHTYGKLPVNYLTKKEANDHYASFEKLYD